VNLLEVSWLLEVAGPNLTSPFAGPNGREQVQVSRLSGRYRLFAFIAAASLALGLAVATFSYLSASLSIPGMARAATTAELEDRGAAIYYKFCSWPKFEPNFWPECRNGAAEWRARGAERLVAFCAEQAPSRMFGADDCLSPDRPIASLTAAPQWTDAAVGMLAAVLAFAVLVLFTVSRRRLAPAPGRQ